MDELANNLPTGYVLDQYSISAVLGTGSFGITYKAYDNQLQQSVAIKEYLPADMAGRASDSTSVQPRKDSSGHFRYGLDKFLEEARTLARFRHPNIVRVTRFLETNGTAYLVMDYVEGESLQEYLKRTRKPVDEAQLKAWFTPLLQGLKTVHDAGFLHRDIKPGNIYLRDNGEPVLIDFGAARQALGEQSKSVTGIFTAGYAPTEQYGTDAKKQGPWTDLYSIGATLYRCIAGQTPVDAPTRQSALVEGDADPLVPARMRGAGQYSPAFLQLIDELLVLPIRDRPQTVAPVLAALVAGKSVFGGELRGDAATVLAARPGSAEAETVVVSDHHKTSGPKKPAPAQSNPGMIAVEPAKKGVNLKVVGVIAALLIAGLLISALVTMQRNAAEVEARNAAQAAEQLRLAETAKAEAEANAQAEARKRAEAEANAQAEAQKRAAAEASAMAEAQARALAEAEAQAAATAQLEAQAQAKVAAKSQAKAQKREAAGEEDGLAAMQRQLNAEVMAQPFDPGDLDKINTYIEDAMANDIKPVGRAPSYWQSGYTCDYIRQYRYEYDTYRNCLYHYRYYGRYW